MRWCFHFSRYRCSRAEAAAADRDRAPRGSHRLQAGRCHRDGARGAAMRPCSWFPARRSGRTGPGSRPTERTSRRCADFGNDDADRAPSARRRWWRSTPVRALRITRAEMLAHDGRRSVARRAFHREDFRTAVGVRRGPAARSTSRSAASAGAGDSGSEPSCCCRRGACRAALIAGVVAQHI